MTRPSIPVKVDSDGRSRRSLSQIPTSEIAAKLGADEGEVDKAVQTLVPVLLSGLQHNSQDPEHASKIESAASGHAARGLLDAGGGVDAG